jgi:hypothetical protein
MATSQQNALPLAMTLPNLSFHQTKQAKAYCGVIEENGVEIYRVTHLEEFYRTYGYSQDMQKTGLLPDEFIWEEYIKKNCSSCLKIHMIRYLVGHSETFRKKYADQYTQWLETHAQERADKNLRCFTCKMKLFCDR